MLYRLPLGLIALVCACGGASTHANTVSTTGELENSESVESVQSSENVESSEHSLSGSRVVLQLPAGFARFPHQAGWVSMDPPTAVMISEHMVSLGTDEVWLRSYLDGISDSVGGVEWDLKQQHGRTFFSSDEVIFYGVVLRHETQVAVVMVRAHSLSRKPLVTRILQSARFDMERPIRPLDVMQVTMEVAPGLELRPEYPMLALRDEDDDSPGTPVVAVRHIPVQGEIDLDVLEPQLGRSLQTFNPDSQTIETTRTEFHGVAGIRTRARGTRNGISIWVESFLLQGTNGAFLILAWAHDEAWHPRILTMLQSFRPNG